jgi:hypothetical protein
MKVRRASSSTQATEEVLRSSRLVSISKALYVSKYIQKFECPRVNYRGFLGLHVGLVKSVKMLES